MYDMAIYTSYKHYTLEAKLARLLDIVEVRSH